MQFCSPNVRILLRKMQSTEDFGKVPCNKLLQILGAIQTFEPAKLSKILDETSSLTDLHTELIALKRGRVDHCVDKPKLL